MRGGTGVEPVVTRGGTRDARSSARYSTLVCERPDDLRRISGDHDVGWKHSGTDRTKAHNRILSDPSPRENPNLGADPYIVFQDYRGDANRGVRPVPIDLDAVEIAVHDARLAKDRSFAHSDLAITAKARPVDERVVAHRDQGIARICPGRHSHADPDVVAEDHPPRPADDEPAFDAQVAAGLEANATKPEPGSAPETLEYGSRLSNRDPGFTQPADKS